MNRYQLYIDGQFADPQGGFWFQMQNPCTGETVELAAAPCQLEDRPCAGCRLHCDHQTVGVHVRFYS